MVIITFTIEKLDEEAVQDSPVQDEKEGGETLNHFIDTLRTSWQVVLNVVLTVLLLIVIIVTVTVSNNSKELQKENNHIRMRLKSTHQNVTSMRKENRRFQELLSFEQNSSMQLKAKNQQKHALLFSDRFSFLWRLCNKSTLKCSRCLPGWTEHASRCFFLSPIQRSWENTRRECFSENGDLAVVLNEADQAFLTTLTYQFVKQNPQVDFYSAWIGLQDMVREGRYWWVNGNELNSKVVYWRHLEPNNAIASWDIQQSG
nr:C-type lectin domain family 4 member M-like [Labrus bergylta]